MTIIRIDVKHTITAKAALSAGTAYTLTKSRVFTTGSLEDAVIFTSIPYDQYTYRVLSHSNPELVGGTIVVSLPREPVVLMVERQFFNDIFDEADLKIDSTVFSHIIGDLSSYPTVSDKNRLKSQYGGLENGPQSVGEGAGEVELGLEVSNEVSEGKSLEMEYVRSVDVTVGSALFGYSVGAGFENNLTVTSGMSTTYTGVVGNIDEQHFAENQYSFGIFTYVQDWTGQEIEVINYWVE